MSISTKLIAVLLVLSLAPLGILGYISTSNVDSLGTSAEKNLSSLGENAVASGEIALESLVKSDIREKAELSASHVKTYVESHPDMTMAELKEDERFREILSQMSGEGGSTILFNLTIQRVAISEEKELEGMDMMNMLTGAIHKAMEEGRIAENFFPRLMKQEDLSAEFEAEVPGYGKINNYMCFEAIEGVKTADHMKMTLALMEPPLSKFTKPMEKLESNVNTTLEDMSKETEESKSDSRNSTLITIGVMAAIVVGVGYFFTDSIVSPIKKLQDAAEQISKGNFDVDVSVESEDEIGELSNSFSRMKNSLQLAMKQVGESESED